MGFGNVISSLNNKLSPILPLHFDKSYLPSIYSSTKIDDLCEL